MKKFAAFFLALAMMLALTACGGSDPKPSPSQAQPGQSQTGGETEYTKIKLVASAFSTEDNAISINDRFFIDLIKERSGGSVEVEEYWAGTLAGATAAFEAMSTRQADMGTIATFFNPSELPLTQISMAVPFGAVTPRQAGEALNKLREMYPEEFDSEYAKQGLVCLYSKGTENYNLITKNHVESISDLAGTKVAVAGVYAPSWFEAIGAVTTAADATAAYQNLKTNVYPSTFIYGSSYVQYSLYEVCSYVLDMDGGARCPQAYVMNKEAFDSLNPATQELVRQCAQEAAEKYYDWMDEQITVWRQTLVDNGVTVITLSDAERRAWGDAIFSAPTNSIQKWIDAADAAGYNGGQIMSDYLKILSDLGCELPYDISAFTK